MKAILKICGQGALMALIAIAFVALGTARAHAATFYMSPASGEFKHGCTNSVRVMINTGGVASTAADILLQASNIEILGIRGGNAYTNYAGGGNRFTGFSIGSSLNGTATFATVNFRNKNEAESGTIGFVVGGSTNTVIADGAGLNILTGATGGTYSFVSGPCVVDTEPPKLINADPAAGARGVPLDSNIKFHLTDSTGVNIDSVVVTIEGITYGTKTPNNFKYSGSKTDYAIDINPIKDFEPETPITVYVEASDLVEKPNTLKTSYSFNKPLPPPPEPPSCEELGCITECPDIEEVTISTLDRPLLQPSTKTELERHFAAEEFEPEITCFPKTKTEERKIDESTLETGVELPEGYEMIMEPMKITCKTPFNMTINVPRFYEDVRVMACNGESCNYTTTEYTQTTECGGKIVDVNRNTVGGTAVLRELRVEEKTEQLTEENRVLESSGVKINVDPSAGNITIKIEETHNTLPEAENPGLKIVSPSTILTVYEENKVGAYVQIPFEPTSYTYPESASIYALRWNKYYHVGGDVDVVNKKVTVHVDNLNDLRDQDGKVKLAVMSVICSNCAGAQVKTAHEPEMGSNTVVLLVHGLSGDAATFGDLITDIQQTKQPYTVMTFGYPTSNMTIEEIVKDFREVAGPKLEPYNNVIIVGHNIGSIIAQEALHKSSVERDGYISKVEKLISIGAPNKGSVITGAYRELFKTLVNKSSKYNELFDLNSTLLPLLEEGREVPRVQGIEYYAIAGTKPYTTMRDATTEANDGIVSTDSAKCIGGESVKNQCSDSWELNVNHTDLLHDYQARQIIGQIIRQSVDDARTKTFGTNKYFNINVNDCSEDTRYIVIGKRVSNKKDLATADCHCGDGFCGIEENRYTCPSDCAIFLGKITVKHLLYFLGIMGLAIITGLALRLHRYKKFSTFLGDKSETLCKKIKNTSACRVIENKIAEQKFFDKKFFLIMKLTGAIVLILIILAFIIGM